jgi:hypothetical protein
MPGDIVILPENTKGKDWFIADVHGNDAQFKSFIRDKKLTRRDRIVLNGDLIDKGPDSFGLCLFIMACQRKFLKGEDVPEIWVTKGNHEDQFLKDFAKGPAHLEAQARKSKSRKWIADCFDRGEQQELAAINKWFSSFSTLTYAGGRVPYCVAHAEVPISIANMWQRVATGQGLTPQERNHAMYARPARQGEKPGESKRHIDAFINPVRWNQRTENSPIALVGHTNDEEPEYEKIFRPIRAETNTLVTDVNSADYGAFLVVNLTRGTAEVYSDQKALTDEQLKNQQKNDGQRLQVLETRCQDLTHHLTRYKADCEARAIVASSKDKSLLNQASKAWFTVTAKESYLTALRRLAASLDITGRKALAKQILITKDHLLAKERWRWPWQAEYSDNTASMKEALEILDKKSEFAAELTQAKALRAA